MSSIAEQIENIIERVALESEYSKSKSDSFGEVFTPNELINEMLDRLPEGTFNDSKKTFFDPCAGKGNFPIQIVKRLFEGTRDSIPDDEKRLKNIIENQIYMCELQDSSANFIKDLFTFNRGLKVNLYHGDTLKMPEDYFENGESREVHKQADLFDLFG